MAELDTIYDHETAIEEALRTAFTAQGINAYTRVNVSAELQLARPWLGIKVQLGSANNHYHLLANGEQRLDQFSCTVQLSLIAAPSNEEEANTLMPQFRARVRSFMGTIDRASRQDETTFPTHCLSRVADAGTEYQVEQDKGVEISRLSYTGFIAVRPSAWPS